MTRVHPLQLTLDVSKCGSRELWDSKQRPTRRPIKSRRHPLLPKRAKGWALILMGMYPFDSHCHERTHMALRTGVVLKEEMKWGQPIKYDKKPYVRFKFYYNTQGLWCHLV